MIILTGGIFLLPMVLSNSASLFLVISLLAAA
jgi:hypothetical protein